MLTFCNTYWVTARRWLLPVFVCVYWAGCRPDEQGLPESQTAAELLASDSRFSLLTAALTRAGLTTALGQGNLTVFAPTNAAFNAAGFADQAAIDRLSPQQLRNLLTYHVLGSEVRASNVPGGGSTVQQSLLAGANGTLFVARTGAGVLLVNGARVQQADVPVRNGYVHVIDRVLTAPSRTLLAQAQADTTLTLLVTAVQRADTSLANLLGRASATGLTLFAPTNAAFREINLGTTAAINAAPVATLNNVLRYHVVAAPAFSSALSNGQRVRTAQGDSLTINVAGNVVTVLGSGNGTRPARVTRPDVLANNGVLHVVDRVLLPR